MSTLILWSANRYGYSVRVIRAGQTIHEYVSGNCGQDSKVFLDPSDPGTVSEDELRTYAVTTARELAAEYSTNVVEEDMDMIDLAHEQEG